MTPSARRGWAAGAVAIAAVALGVWLWPRDQPRKLRGAESDDRSDAPGATEPAATRRPRRPPRTGPRRPAPLSGDAQPAPSPTLAAPNTAAPTREVGRVEQLQTTVLQEAVKGDWMTVDERDSPCPPERIRIVYDVPSDLKKYTKGAYFEPLGPAPSTSSDEVNGLLVCDGSTFLYRGFEAYYRADRGQWDVYPFPVIE